ncbi:TetR/AcrR family transcriptional regulator [Phenylobacterium aquaticum]|uniref:TetR/AcrR family transcriptional regulator n=1 Tax=Phenylobacterium aquaticum TaxID=1763816 RepID=UPI0026EFDC2A|nr:TetR/AcrR family transcriptional regulator [Phenylobacterium aquaticum]
MTIRDDRRAAALALMADHLLAEGLAGASLRPLAKAAGISDRMLLYYFADKEEVLSLTLLTIAGRLQGDLAAVSSEPVSPRALAPVLWGVLQGPSMKPVMALWLELAAAAARGQEPFVRIGTQIGEGFLDWVEARLAVAPGVDRRATAALVLGVIDGLVMMGGVGQAALAERALALWDLPSGS